MLFDDKEDPTYKDCTCNNCHFGNIPGMEDYCMFGGGVFHKMYEADRYCCHRWRENQTDTAIPQNSESIL